MTRRLPPLNNVCAYKPCGKVLHGRPPSRGPVVPRYCRNTDCETLARLTEGVRHPPVATVPTPKQPQRIAYGATCHLCGREWKEDRRLTLLELATLRPERCEHCGGRMLVTPADPQVQLKPPKIGVKR